MGSIVAVKYFAPFLPTPAIRTVPLPEPESREELVCVVAKVRHVSDKVMQVQVLVEVCQKYLWAPVWVGPGVQALCWEPIFATLFQIPLHAFPVAHARSGTFHKLPKREPLTHVKY
jgi:hypothetical protein